MTVPCAPFSHEAQRLQPFVFLPTGVYVLTRQPQGAATLVSAAGVPHALRELASARTWQEHTARHAREDLLRAIAAGTAVPGVVRDEEAAAYFLSVLVPAFDARNWGDDAPAPTLAPSAPVTEELEAIARTAPAPRLPGPGLLTLGRLWLLEEGTPSARWHVRAGAATFAPTGRTIALASLVNTWRATVRDFVADVAAHVAARLTPVEPPGADARHELARTGALERGDLVLLQTSPPLLGHIIPSHQNRTLQRRSDRDLLLATPLGRIAATNGLRDLQVFGRTPGAARGWQPVQLPRGICLGPGLSVPDGLAPHLALAAGLRWAAIRIAGNGRFHEADC